MNRPREPKFLRVDAASVADELGYRAQHAVSRAIGPGTEYRLVGGHMVRHLLTLYPSSEAVQRSTRDADAAAENVQVVAPFVDALMADNFMKLGGNILVKDDNEAGSKAINILLAENRPRAGLGHVTVPGAGQVDTLPELSFALMYQPILIDVEANMMDGTILLHETCIPGVEAATVLKAHAWKERRAEKDLADLHSLPEIRHEHQDSAACGAAPAGSAHRSPHRPFSRRELIWVQRQSRPNRTRDKEEGPRILAFLRIGAFLETR